ncbi:MAG: hypothetical protein LBH43_19085 [Treponema sp.]|jgi:hypothetical protein|nr:hypothetical protein [Treponema sp.]
MVIVLESAHSGQGTCKSLKAPVFVFLAVLFILNSCTRNNANAVLNPPPTDPLSRDFLGFGVVTVSFTHLWEEPGGEGASLGYLRKGSLVKILERKAVNYREGTVFWLLAVYEDGALEGWFRGDSVEVYDNESRAITASKSMIP